METRRERRENEKRRIIKRIRIIMIVFILYIIIICAYWLYKETTIKTTHQTESFNIVQIPKEEKQVVDKELIVSEYMGYEVAAQLQIPKIDFDCYVLGKYSKEAMDVSPTKYWGPNANDIGNFCITGHNYKKENMFSELINLQKGDEIYLTDNKNGKFTYTIYDIYKVRPNDTECLEPDEENRRELTLVTCTSYGNYRLIIKAYEHIAN